MPQIGSEIENIQLSKINSLVLPDKTYKQFVLSGHVTADFASQQIIHAYDFTIPEQVKRIIIEHVNFNGIVRNKVSGLYLNVDNYTTSIDLVPGNGARFDNFGPWSIAAPVIQDASSINLKNMTDNINLAIDVFVLSGYALRIQTRAYLSLAFADHEYSSSVTVKGKYI